MEDIFRASHSIYSLPSNFPHIQFRFVCVFSFHPFCSMAQCMRKINSIPPTWSFAIMQIRLNFQSSSRCYCNERSLLTVLELLFNEISAISEWMWGIFNIQRKMQIIISSSAICRMYFKYWWTGGDIRVLIIQLSRVFFMRKILQDLISKCFW